MSDYHWTLDDVRDARRRAELKRVRWAEARDSAGAIEREYWTRLLVAKFPQLEYRTDDQYTATIGFSTGDEICMVRGPRVNEYGSVRVLVWHKGSKGKFNKLAQAYRCEEIVPFIQAVIVHGEKEEVPA